MDAQGHSVFISHASEDAKEAMALVETLERFGIGCWIAPRNISPGEEYASAILEALQNSKVVILILSSHSNLSRYVSKEVERSVSKNIPVVTFRIQEVAPSSPMELFVYGSQWIDGFQSSMAESAKKLVDALKKISPDIIPKTPPQADAVPQREGGSKGYVFISYVRSDFDFVQKLRKVFESKKYGYWDYVVGSRDYHGTLYRELEERIDGAVAFMTIVTDEWRQSDWVASEFIYARESRIPIFVVQAKKLTRPLPILLNLQTRIDMSGDFEIGAATLAEELSKKGL